MRRRSLFLPPAPPAPLGLRLTLLSLALCVSSGCKRDPVLAFRDGSTSIDPVPLAADPAPAPARAPEASAKPRLLPPRCTKGNGSAVLGEKAGDIEIGNAVATKAGVAVGMRRATGQGRMASVAFIDSAYSKVSFVDLGLALGDAPAPRLAMRGSEIVAALYARDSRAAKATRTAGDVKKAGALDATVATEAGVRTLELVKLVGAKSQSLATIVQGKDDSYDFDVVLGEHEGLVAWDEDAVPATRGVVKVAQLMEGAPVRVEANISRVVSPEGSDVESPRLASRPGGYWLVWMARKADRSNDTPDRVREGPGEDRDFCWLELAVLDEKGNSLERPRQLTSATGHVDSFDIAARGDGTLDVVAHDATEASDGAGERILRATVSAAVVDVATALVESDVGRGSADLLRIDGSSPWLVYTDVSDHTRIMLLAQRGVAPIGASLESVLDGAMPLAVVRSAVNPGASSSGDSSSIIAYYPDKERAELRVVICTP